MQDTTHLVALQVRLSHERAALAAHKTLREDKLRTVWIAQIEKEIATEMAFLGMTSDVSDLDTMSDDDLLAALGA